MKSRIDLAKVSPEPLKLLRSVEAWLAQCGLEHSLLHLVKMGGAGPLQRARPLGEVPGLVHVALYFRPDAFTR